MVGGVAVGAEAEGSVVMGGEEGGRRRRGRIERVL